MLILLLTALLISAIGFHKYVWFISLGYGFSIAALGLVLLLWFRGSLTAVTAVLCVLFILYGLRLGGYLAIRERKSVNYNKLMKQEIKDGTDMNLGVKCAIWVTCALLYALEVSPVYFRLKQGAGGGVMAVLGAVIMLGGLTLETCADLQKNAQKKVNPRRFCDKGLFRLVRCPNYLGEMVFWTGTFLSGVTVLHGAFQWGCALLGYLGIIYVMFSGARRLEIRQNKNYGSDPEYRRYVETTPIMVPFVPLYSVEKYKFLVA